MTNVKSRQEVKIIELINKFQIAIPNYIISDFNSKLLDEWAFKTPISDAERLIVQFLLGVWDRYSKWKVGKFDFFEAANKLGTNEWGVIVEWCQNPFFL